MIPLPPKAQQIIDTLVKNGFEAYAVGGSVRDMIMGKATFGWDFTTNAIPEQILSLFSDSFYDNKFGTVGIKIYRETKISRYKDIEKQKDKTEQELEVEDIYEVTTYRSEEGYSDLRHPDRVTWGKTLKEDLSRRDFTINAIAYDGKMLFDPFGGMRDIDEKIIKAVGNPSDRFSEDALRMMRAVRIASELGFTIEGETFVAIAKNPGLIEYISWERVRDELLKIMKSPFASDGVLVLKNTGLLRSVLPELEASFATPQKSPKRHHLYDVGMHSVMALKYCPSKDPIVRLATLLHDLGKPQTYKQDPEGLITFYNHEVVGTAILRHIAKRLRFSKKDTTRLLTLARWHQFSVDEGQTDAALRRFIRRVGKENLEDILALRIGDRLGGGARETSWRLELFKKRLEDVQKQPFSVRDLKVNGFDVMKIFNSKPGPTIGITLEKIFQEVEEGTLLNERDSEINRLKELRVSSDNTLDAKERKNI